MQTQTSRSCTKPLWNVNMAYYTVYDALLQCSTSALPTCHTLITSTNGTVTALPPTSVSMTTATKTALTRSEACFCHPKHSAFCHVFPKILLARHFVRWWGLWSATRLFTADIMAEVDWSRVTTQRKDKTQMRSLWYYNYFSNKTRESKRRLSVKVKSNWSLLLSKYISLWIIHWSMLFQIKKTGKKSIFVLISYVILWKWNGLPALYYTLWFSDESNFFHISQYR